MRQKKNWQVMLFIFSIILHTFFYISAHFTGTLDPFFDKVTRGQDFFQIPNGAYAFLHGGELTGKLPYNKMPYTACCGVNNNVYHPIFTLLVGIPLQSLSPWVAFGTWTILHFFTTAITVIFFLWKFQKHRYIYLALSIFLLNSFHYYEIQHAQYHFLLNTATIFFLYFLFEKKETHAGIFYFISLFIKPIGLLWLLPLMFYRHFKTALIGITLYIGISLPALFIPSFQYFFKNLYSVSTSQYPTHNLASITHLYEIPLFFIKIFAVLLGGTLVVVSFIRKKNLFTIFFAWIAFQLLFYTLVFHYHFSILAGLFMIGILYNHIPLTKRFIIPLLFLTFPTLVIFFHLTGSPASLLPKEYSIDALWSIGWLIIFTLVLLIKKEPNNEHNR